MDLRSGRCPSCAHGEVVETLPFVTVDGSTQELFAIRGVVPLELWTCARCGLSQLSVRDPAKLVQVAGETARRVQAEPPPGTFDVRIVRELPSDGAARVGMEAKIARVLGIDVRRAAMTLDGRLPIVLARGLDWNAAEHARATLARFDVIAEIAPSAPVGYR